MITHLWLTFAALQWNRLRRLQRLGRHFSGHVGGGARDDCGGAFCDARLPVLRRTGDGKKCVLAVRIIDLYIAQERVVLNHTLAQISEYPRPEVAEP